MYEQMSLFGLMKPEYKIENKIRLIELFSGYGSQAMALRRLGADFEHYRSIEFDKYAMASYNAVHGTNFEPTDINDVKGVDLGIVDKSRFTYLLTHSHAQISVLQGVWPVWRRTAIQDHPCYGRLKGYWKNCMRQTVYRRFFSWKT